MHHFTKRLGFNTGRFYIIPATVITFCMGLALLLALQVVRMQANDPQVEIAEGVSEALNQGQDPQAFGSLNPTDISKSLSPFVIVLDQEGKIISGTAVLDGQAPIPPKELLEASKLTGERRVTWEPKSGVRIASVIKPYSFTQDDQNFSGFVLAGKSLREANARQQNLLQIAGLAWAIGLVVAWIAVTHAHSKKEEHSEHEHSAHSHEHHHS